MIKLKKMLIIFKLAIRKFYQAFLQLIDLLTDRKVTFHSLCCLSFMSRHTMVINYKFFRFLITLYFLLKSISRYYLLHFSVALRSEVFFLFNSFKKITQCFYTYVNITNDCTRKLEGFIVIGNDEGGPGSLIGSCFCLNISASCSIR